MKIEYKKQPTKYLGKSDANTRRKILRAIQELVDYREGKTQVYNGDVQSIQGSDLYRIKIEHYRIGFTYDADTDVITITAVLPRGKFYKFIRRR